MNWTTIELKWHEMAVRLQASAVQRKGRGALALPDEIISKSVRVQSSLAAAALVPPTGNVQKTDKRVTG